MLDKGVTTQGSTLKFASGDPSVPTTPEEVTSAQFAQPMPRFVSLVADFRFNPYGKTQP